MKLVALRFFSAAATNRWAGCNHNVMPRWRNVLPLSGTQASGRELRLEFHKRIKRHGFLRQTCRKKLLSAVCHILGA